MVKRSNFFIKLISGIILTTTLFLNGCSTLYHPNGLKGDVDESNIPDAVPKNEPLSQSGNSDSYTVHGRRYHTLKSSNNYHQEGIASYYSSQFHHVRTSSGERYNKLGMTAAHKTLPLPTYVQVTNLANGKKVIVKVNDRGPFQSNRLIDVSYIAAKKLGMLGHGTARVVVQSINLDNNRHFAENKHHRYSKSKARTEA